MKLEQGFHYYRRVTPRLRSNRLEEVLYPRVCHYHALISVCVLLFARCVFLPQGMAADALLVR